MFGEVGGHRRRGAQVLRVAPERVHDAARPSRCARSSSRCRATREGSTWPRTRPRRRRPSRFARARSPASRSRSWPPKCRTPPSKANGGLIGPLNATELSPDFRKLIEALKAGRCHAGRAHAARLPDAASSSRRRRRRRCRSNRRASRSASAWSPTSAREEFQKYLTKLRAQAIIEWKSEDVKKAYEEGLAEQAQGERRRRADRSLIDHGISRAVVRHLDAVAPRAGRPRATRPQARRSLPADHHPVEPMEGSEEESRLAAVPRLLLRALRSRGHAADSQVHRRRQHRVVRGQARADSGIRAREHPRAGRQRTAIRPVPDDPRRHDGRSRLTARCEASSGG